jgi:hypothetical protein
MNFRYFKNNSVINNRPFDHYISSCISIAKNKLYNYSSIKEIAAHEKEINRYPRLERLSPPKQIFILDFNNKTTNQVSRAVSSVARGEILFEHAAAGEGTRLMLGPKYFLNIARDFSVKKITHLLSKAVGKLIDSNELEAQLDCSPLRSYFLLLSGQGTCCSYPLI